eukprot:CAMPEP_0171637108 /NCGR_PEP_ID=MMETSP0990-20121206/27928_1 /TAXON_ID=483369 /ORGANISM="non described non described, Strain CCMP2098" /LENGTH=49 /DNA_ID= /DNA_START= /DNA_END= /DNA_ORIENTATION=
MKKVCAIVRQRLVHCSTATNKQAHHHGVAIRSRDMKRGCTIVLPRLVDL